MRVEFFSSLVVSQSDRHGQVPKYLNKVGQPSQ
jgi:hypothetical protein